MRATGNQRMGKKSTKFRNAFKCTSSQQWTIYYVINAALLNVLTIDVKIVDFWLPEVLWQVQTPTRFQALKQGLIWG
jgi:hypothetical protein